MLFSLLFPAIRVLLQNLLPALALLLQELRLLSLFVVPELRLIFPLLPLPIDELLQRFRLFPFEVLRALLVLEVLGDFLVFLTFRFCLL